MTASEIAFKTQQEWKEKCQREARKKK